MTSLGGANTLNRYPASIFKLNPSSCELQQDDSECETQVPPTGASVLTRGLRWDAEEPGASHQQPTITPLPKICDIGQDFIASQPHGDICLHVSPAFTSYLQLSFHLHDDTAPGGLKQTCMRLTRETCSKLELVEVDGGTYSELVWETGSPDTDYCYYVLFIQFDTGRFFSENLFSHSPSHSLLLLQNSLMSTPRLAVVFKMGIGTATQFKECLRSLIAKFQSRESGRLLQDPMAFLDRGDRSPALRSNTIEPPRASFFSWEDYVATLGVGTEIVKQAIENTASDPFNCAIHVVGTEPGNARRYFAVFQIPRGCHVEFSPGDKATVEFDANVKAVSNKYWSMQVIEPLPWSDKGVVTVCLELGERVTSEETLPVTPIPKGYRGSGFRDLLAKPGMNAMVSPEDRHSEFPYIMKAFNKLRKDKQSAGVGSMVSAVCQFLVGNKASSIPEKDIYESLANKDLAAEESMNLNESQKGAIRMARSAPAGFVLCHGGPGTGKTHFVAEAVKPFFRDSEREHRVLLTAQGNRAADALALGVEARMQPLTASGQIPGYRYSLRLQSIKTEKSIFFRSALESRRAKMLAGRTQTGNATTTTLNLPHPRQADSIAAHCRAFAACKYEFVKDNRVQHIELSVGHKMRQILGLEPDGPDIPNKPSFATLAGLYRRFADGKLLSSEEMVSLDDEVENLMRFTISNAAAVSATIAGAADHFFSESYSEAELIVVDEASRVPEYHWWPLLAFYPKAVGKIMVGDYFQLPPRVDEHPDMRNPCQKQLEMSLQERGQTMGIQSTFFTVQYRAMPAMAEVYSKVCYQSRLVSDPSTYLDCRPLAKEIVNHNKAMYGTEKSIIFVDMPYAVQMKDGKTNFCLRYGNMVLRILEDLLKAGFGTTMKPCKIAILTPYKSQLNKLWVAKKEMSAIHATAAAKDVYLETADKVQGMEYDVVIIDPVVVSYGGFLTMQRLNVLFSRAKFGLYVCGNLAAWKRLDGENAEWLRAFGEALSTHEVRLSAAQMRGSVELDDE